MSEKCKATCEDVWIVLSWPKNLSEPHDENIQNKLWGIYPTKERAIETADDVMCFFNIFKDKRKIVKDESNIIVWESLERNLLIRVIRATNYYPYWEHNH